MDRASASGEGKAGREPGGFLDNLRHDLPAGVVVFFVAIPLCLGIALASGAPLFSGLIAGIVGGLLVGAISRSPLGVSGPAAGLAVIVLGAIQDLGDFRVFLVAVVLAGLIQVVLGLARAGVLAYFFPSAVIKGMLAGIGLIIFLKQLPHAVGHDSDPEGELDFVQPDGETTLSALGHLVQDITPSAVLLSVASLVILIVWEKVLARRARFFQLVQGPLVVVALGIVFQVLTKRFAPEWALSGNHVVNVPVADSISGFFGQFTTPDWSKAFDPRVFMIAGTMAVVASLETLLCVEATDRLDPLKRVTPTNRELVAQGVGNMASGLVGGLPITQVIVRSSANIQSGGRTKIAAIFHGALLLAFVVTLPHVLNLIPLSVLAAILLVVGYKLARPALWVQIWKLGMWQFSPFAVTVLGIVFTDLLMGIGMGMAVALMNILYRNYNNSHFLHLEERDEPGGPHVVRMQLSEEISFLNRGAILRELSNIEDGSKVILDASRCVHMNQDVAEIIDDFKESANRRNITIEVIESAPPPVQLSRAS